MLDSESIQNTGLKRKTIDKFYTSSKTVNECVEIVRKNIKIEQDDLCIEPSAGNGSFISKIKSLFKNYLFYDIEPEDDEITQQDFLKYDHTKIETKGKIHILGNPPFGRQSSLAIKFIKKSAEFCDSISFILPKSFKKNSLQNKFPLNFHLICEYEIPDNSFLVDNSPHDVPCVFQIWEKKNYEREIPKKITPKNYKFVKKTEDHDISFRRVGINSGKIDTDTESKSHQSHYFIKFNKKISSQKLEELSNIKFGCKNDTCGPRSISKPELILEFNRLL